MHALLLHVWRHGLKPVADTGGAEAHGTPVQLQAVQGLAQCLSQVVVPCAWRVTVVAGGGAPGVVLESDFMRFEVGAPTLDAAVSSVCMTWVGTSLGGEVSSTDAELMMDVASTANEAAVKLGAVCENPTAMGSHLPPHVRMGVASLWQSLCLRVTASSIAWVLRYGFPEVCDLVSPETTGSWEALAAADVVRAKAWLLGQQARKLQDWAAWARPVLPPMPPVVMVEVVPSPPPVMPSRHDLFMAGRPHALVVPVGEAREEEGGSPPTLPTLPMLHVSTEEHAPTVPMAAAAAPAPAPAVAKKPGTGGFGLHFLHKGPVKKHKVSSGGSKPRPDKEKRLRLS